MLVRTSVDSSLNMPTFFSRTSIKPCMWRISRSDRLSLLELLKVMQMRRARSRSPIKYNRFPSYTDREETSSIVTSSVLSGDLYGNELHRVIFSAREHWSFRRSSAVVQQICYRFEPRRQVQRGSQNASVVWWRHKIRMSHFDGWSVALGARIVGTTWHLVDRSWNLKSVLICMEDVGDSSKNGMLCAPFLRKSYSPTILSVPVISVFIQLPAISSQLLLWQSTWLRTLRDRWRVSFILLL